MTTSPDVCKLSNGTPTPFPTFARFSWAVREVPTVRFEGRPATDMNVRISRVGGDESGVGGGNRLSKSDGSGRHGGIASRYVYSVAGRLTEV